MADVDMILLPINSLVKVDGPWRWKHETFLALSELSRSPRSHGFLDWSTRSRS